MTHTKKNLLLSIPSIENIEINTLSSSINTAFMPGIVSYIYCFFYQEIVFIWDIFAF